MIKKRTETVQSMHQDQDKHKPMYSSHGVDVEGRWINVMTKPEVVTFRIFCVGLLTGNVSMICPIWAAATVKKAEAAQVHY